ncbi:MAG: penicillin-binding protein [Chitinophagales bacterium]|nr:transpeptidase family protein [Chitinophagales bacterium]MDW8392948.1 penicillin-binding protein [Chitinophagales bacterium]
MSEERKRELLWRIALVYVLLVALSIGIALRLVYIQQIEGRRYLALMDSVVTRYVSVPAQRGNIYSADGRLLATTMPSFEVRMDLRADGLTSSVFQSGVDSLSRMLSQLFGDRSPAQYKKMLVQARKRGERYLLIKKNVTYAQLQQLRTFPIFRLGQFKGGLIVATHHRRMYPYRRLANRTIGYLRDASVQPVGLEAQYNAYLTGQSGKRLVQKVNGGQFLPVTDKNEMEPVNGRDLVIAINVQLQDVAESTLERALQEHRAHHGCCVIMETRTGAIRALVNLTRQPDGTYAEDYNYAIAESHEPGSTFKLASLLALLQDGYVSLADSIDLNYGTYAFWNQVMRDAEPHGHRKVDVLTAFALSSNVGIARLVVRHYQKDPARFIAHLRRFGLDKKTGIDLPGEPNPYIKSVKDPAFTQYSLPWMSVGYELKLTPLQMLCFYNAIANQGQWVQPYLLEHMESYGSVVERRKPVTASEPLCSPQALQALQKALETVVSKGTAKNIKNSYYSIAGKTGTSLLADDDGGYEQRRYLASFVGYFPAEDPRYTMIVMVHEPSAGRYYGAQVAAPVFREIADKIYASDLQFHQHPQRDSSSAAPKIPVVPKARTGDVQTVLAALDAPLSIQGFSEWISVDEQGQPHRQSDVAWDAGLPDVRGLGLRNALYLLETAGCRVQAEGSGLVVQQWPAPATPVRRGQVVTLQLALQP